MDLAIKYTPFVKALLGSILELTGMSKESLKLLKESLTGISKYRLPISGGYIANQKELENL